MTQENNEHALRAEVIMRYLNQMPRGPIETHAEGRMSQER